jgi:hypothetical protein
LETAPDEISQLGSIETSFGLAMGFFEGENLS